MVVDNPRLQHQFSLLDGSEVEVIGSDSEQLKFIFQEPTRKPAKDLESFSPLELTLT